jgi:hypothetical protein
MPNVLSGGVVCQNRLLFQRPIPRLLSILPCLIKHVYITITISSSARPTVKVAGSEISLSRFRIPDQLCRSEYSQAPLDNPTDMEESDQDVWSQGIEGCIASGGRECRLRGCRFGQDFVESWKSDGESGQLGKSVGI